MKTWMIVPALGLGLIAAGCQQTRSERALTGAAIGGAGGALIGAAAGGTAGAAVAGGVIGAAAGALIADATRPGWCYYYDHRGRKKYSRC